MKRLPRWLKVTMGALAVVTIVFGVFVVRAVIEFSDSFQTLLSEQFYEATGGRIEIDGITWHWKHLDFHSVHAEAPSFPGTFSVERVRVHISVAAAIRHRVIDAVDRIELASPVLTIDSKSVNQLRRMEPDRQSSAFGAVPNIEIIVGNGSIVYFDLSDDTAIPIASNVSGNITLGDRTFLAISGGVLSEDVNLSAVGAVSLSGDPHDVAIRVRGIQLNRLPGVIADGLSGEVDVEIAISDSLRARVALNEAEVTLHNGLMVGPVSTSVTVCERMAEWAQTELPVSGLTFTSAGRFRWGETPHIEASAVWSGTVEAIGDLLGPAFSDIAGNLRGEFDIEGPLSAPLLSFSLYSDSLSKGGVHAHSIAIEGHSEPLEAGDQPTRLFIDAIRATVEGIPLNGAGAGTLSPLYMNVRLSPTRIPLATIRSAREADISGYITASAGVRVSGRDIWADLRVRNADVLWGEHRVPIDRMDVTRDNTGVVSLNAYGDHARIEFVTVDDSIGSQGIAGRVSFLDYPIPFGDAEHTITGQLDGQIDGTIMDVAGLVDIASPDRIATRLNLSMHRDWEHASSPLTVNVSSEAVPFMNIAPDVTATLTYQNGMWGFRGTALRNTALFSGRANDTDDFAMLVSLRNASAHTLGQLIRMESFFLDGNVTGRVHISSDPDRSMAGSGDFQIQGMVFKEMDSLDTRATIDIDAQTVAWRSTEVVRNGRPVAFTSGLYSRPKHAVEVDVWSAPNGRVEEGLALGGIALDADGDALWSVSVMHELGQIPHPQLRIEVMAANGNLFGVPFDTSNVLIEGDTQWLTLRHGYLRKSGEYTLDTSDGVIPAQASHDGGEFDIPITIRSEPGNNVLNALTTYLGQGLTGDGEGAGQFRIAGPASEIVVGDGWLEIVDGTLTWPGGIWPMWRNVEGRVSISSGTRFLNLERFTAHVGSGRITATNTPANAVGATPLTIDAVDLDLGVIELATIEPIPMRIPSIMPDGESMNIQLRGFESDRQFSISGPLSHPLLIGEVVFSDGYFSYPPRNGNGQTDSQEMRIVQDVNWHVDLVVGRNVFYESRRSESLWRGLLRDPLHLMGSMVVEIEARLARDGRLRVRGVQSDGSLHVVTENISSDQARLSVLDVDFRPDGPLVLEWDTRSFSEPIIRGRGVATVQVEREPSPFAGGDFAGDYHYQPIYARLVSVDPVTGAFRQGGRLGELLVELDTEENRQGPIGQRQQLAVLRMLGYYAPGYGQEDYDPAELQRIDPRDIMAAGYRTMLRRSEQQAWRSLLSPVSRQIRRYTRLDVIDVRPSILMNVIERDLTGREHMTAEQAYLMYLHGTNWTVGEYFWGRFLLSYHGELEMVSVIQPFIGARHQISVEWALSTRTRIEVSRDLDVPYGEPDTRVGLSHRFAFDSY